MKKNQFYVALIVFAIMVMGTVHFNALSIKKIDVPVTILKISK